MIGIELRAAPRLDLRVLPAVIAASEMLQLPSQALESIVEQELESNPALERLDAVECPVCCDSWQARCPVCSPAGPPSRTVDDRGGTGFAGQLDRPAPQTDADALLDVVRLAVDAGDVPVADYLVGSLDHHGFLDQTPGDAAAALGVDESRLVRVLTVIRRMGPPGIGATSVTECLLLQLEALPSVEEEVRALARALVEGHLPALAKGRFTSIAAALRVDRAAVLQAFDLIRERLHPFPAFEGCVTAPNPHVVPDLVVRERRDAPEAFEVELVEPLRLRVGIDPRYLQPSPRLSPRERSRMRGSISEARSFLGRLKDRWDTLRLVAEYTVERQKDFLRAGPAALCPLTRAEVAQALGLHESTVSRAVGGKYVVLPSRKIVPMTVFFSASGGLGEELRRIVSSEERPLSDGELAGRLHAHGYPVARRTVTKHRARLGILPASQR